MSIIFPTIYQNRKQYLYDILKEEHNVSAVGVWSVRKVVSDYSGPCVRLRRGSDDVEQDFGFDAYDILDRWSILEWLGTSEGYLVRWYDQLGSNDMVSSSNDDQPTYRTAGVNRLPQFDGDRASSNSDLTASIPQIDSMDAVFLARAPFKRSDGQGMFWDGYGNFLYSSAYYSLRTYDGNTVLEFGGPGIEDEWETRQVLWRVYQTDSELHLRWDRKAETVSTSNNRTYTETGIGNETYLRFQEIFVFSEVLSDAAFERIDTELNRLKNNRDLDYLGLSELRRCEFAHLLDLYGPEGADNNEYGAVTDVVEQDILGNRVTFHEDATPKGRGSHNEGGDSPTLTDPGSGFYAEQYDGFQYHVIGVEGNEWDGIVGQEFFLCVYVQRTTSSFEYIFGYCRNLTGMVGDGLSLYFRDSNGGNELAFYWSADGKRRQIVSSGSYPQGHTPFIASFVKRNDGSFELWENNTQLSIGGSIDEGPDYNVNPLENITPYIGCLNVMNSGIRTGFDGYIGPRALSTNLSDFDVVRQYMVSRFT